MPIEVNVTNQEIEVSTSGQTVNATVGGGVGPAGPAGPPGNDGDNGPPGVVTANAPISYDAENQSVGWTSFSNGTSLNVGTFDTEIGGYGGISLFCAVGYELNWQAGYLRAVNGDGSTRNIWVESPLEFPGAGTDNVQIDATGITFADGSQQTVAGAPASDFDQGVKTSDAVNFDSVTVTNNSTFEAQVYTSGVYAYEEAANPTGSRSILTFEGVIYPDDSLQTTAWTGSVDWADVNNKPTLFDGAYTSLTSVPSTFTPSAHNQAWSTITSTPTTLAGYGITDAVASNDSRLTDARTPTSHAHGNITNAGAIGSTANLPIITTTSGVLTTGAFGTSSGQFAAGDHTHAQLHDRSHAITSTSDHTATAWRAFYSNGSGVITELALGASGTVLTSGGASAAPTFGNVAYANVANPTVTSPSQITSNQNEYASFARGINRFTTNAARDITGMVAGSDGEVRVLCNTGTTAANTLTIKDESSSSTAANRFSVPWNGDCVIPAEGSVVVFYDGTSSRWRVV